MSGSAKRRRPPSEGGYLVAKAHQIGGRVFAKLLKDEGGGEINPAQGRILFALWRAGGMSVTALSKETALEPSTLTSMLDRLEAGGLVRRSAAPGDRRALVVECSETGLALEARYLAISERMTALFYAGMPAEEIGAFEASLRKIVDNLVAAESR
jgi:MarR family transcriptional regulator, organic hydroperoxide resistance regulator